MLAKRITFGHTNANTESTPCSPPPEYKDANTGLIPCSSNVSPLVTQMQTQNQPHARPPEYKDANTGLIPCSPNVSPLVTQMQTQNQPHARPLHHDYTDGKLSSLANILSFNEENEILLRCSENVKITTTGNKIQIVGQALSCKRLFLSKAKEFSKSN
ncbi:hypothetical protein OUZ56_013203 [Daphnia magna]|uniref:Uncharacterized protein n=1 Tax=Daphnia magna TaxID=35525 RepID=A0ABQ9Z551_9CRUS|nr:hypothetical protein OUZ56_013203 [Daphnia magna]